MGRNDPEISRFYIGLIIVFFYLFAFFKLSYYNAVIIGTTLIGLYILVDVMFMISPPSILLLMALMMLTCDIIGGCIAYIMEHHSKKEFLLQKMLSESAISDALTNLYNRYYFNHYCVNDINAFIARSKNVSQIERRHNDIKAAKYGMIMIDIDYFKRINDTFGHHSGDLVLQQFAEILKAKVRRSDDVLRVGGEEFLLIIKLTTEDYLIEFMKKLGRTIEAFDFRVDGGGIIGCTVSMGIVIIPSAHNDDVIALLKIADRALYKSKEAGRNRGHRGYQLQGAVEFEEIVWNNQGTQ
jgi:diguanylate cyclase (GGDEF)-like protein